MKLLAFVFLLVFLLPCAALADYPPFTWNPDTGKVEYDPNKYGPGDPGPLPPRRRPAPAPEGDGTQTEEKENKAALMALVALLGVAALSREGRAKAEIAVSQHEV